MRVKNKTRKNKKRIGGKEANNYSPTIVNALSDNQINILEQRRRQELALARQREAELARQREADLARQREAANNSDILDLLNSYARGGKRSRRSRTRKLKRKYKK
jgi:hypothetical protein